MNRQRKETINRQKEREGKKEREEDRKKSRERNRRIERDNKEKDNQKERENERERERERDKYNLSSHVTIWRFDPKKGPNMTILKKYIVEGKKMPLPIKKNSQKAQ